MGESMVNEDGFARFNGGYCPENLYLSFIDGICTRFSNTGFFVNCMQFFLVSFMYFNIGKGRYWDIMFYSALTGCIGSLIENGTVAYTCRENDKDVPRKRLIILYLNEIFWIAREYAIPLLNLIKLKTFSVNKTLIRVISYIIYGFFIPYVGCRMYIGYTRMVTGLIDTPQSKYGHTAAFMVLAVADLICSITILVIVRKSNKKYVFNSCVIDQYIKRSSYMTMLFVDLMSIVFAFLNFSTEVYKGVFRKSFVTPFNCLKSIYVLILACDAIIFKYSISYSSSNIFNSNSAIVSQCSNNYNMDNASSGSNGYINHSISKLNRSSLKHSTNLIISTSVDNS